MRGEKNLDDIVTGFQSSFFFSDVERRDREPSEIRCVLDGLHGIVI